LDPGKDPPDKAF